MKIRKCLKFHVRHFNSKKIKNKNNKNIWCDVLCIVDLLYPFLHWHPGRHSTGFFIETCWSIVYFFFLNKIFEKGNASKRSIRFSIERERERQRVVKNNKKYLERFIIMQTLHVSWCSGSQEVYSSLCDERHSICVLKVTLAKRSRSSVVAGWQCQRAEMQVLPHTHNNSVIRVKETDIFEVVFFRYIYIPKIW